MAVSLPVRNSVPDSVYCMLTSLLAANSRSADRFSGERRLPAQVFRSALSEEHAGSRSGPPSRIVSAVHRLWRRLSKAREFLFDRIMDILLAYGEGGRGSGVLLD